MTSFFFSFPVDILFSYVFKCLSTLVVFFKGCVFSQEIDCSVEILRTKMYKVLSKNRSAGI